MKKSLLLVLFLFAVPVFAQEIEESEQNFDLQLWSETTTEGTEIFPWAIYYGKHFVLDVRYNYDEKKTAGIYIGKQLGGDSFYIIPQIGFLVGDFNAWSPEFYLGASKGRFEYFSQWQWAGSLKKDYNSWAYQYQELLIGTGKHISLGAASQTSWEKNTAPVNTDIGPMVKLDFGKDFSARVWYAKRSFGENRGDWVLYCNLGKIFSWK